MKKVVQVQVPEEGAFVVLIVNGEVKHEPIRLVIGDYMERDDGTEVPILHGITGTTVETANGPKYLVYRIFVNEGKKKGEDALTILK